jgi:hypothetical protein
MYVNGYELLSMYLMKEKEIRHSRIKCAGFILKNKQTSTGWSHSTDTLGHINHDTYAETERRLKDT